MDPIRSLSDRFVGVPLRVRLQQFGCGVLLVACVASSPRAADQVARSGPVPGPNDRQITLAVKSYLEREHFLRHPIDDEIAARWFDTFLESLDPQKVYFLQADVDEFASKKTVLDDLVRRGDVSFAYEVYDRFLQRVDERLPWVEQLLDTTLDFNRNESIETDPDETHWAQSPDEAKDKWRKRIKYDLLVQEMEKTPETEAKAKLKRRYRSFAKRMHQTNADELLEIYLVSLTSSLDPHTSFMSPGTLENFEISMRLQLDGIGASLKSEDGYTTVAELVPGGAADKDGRLKKKDRIVGVGQGRDGEVVDVVDMNLNDVVKLIRGERGSVVRLKIIPVGQTVPQVYDIVRAKIELQDSAARGEVIEQGQKPDGKPWRIGVINLPSFYMDMEAARQGQADYKSSTRDCRRLIGEFRQQQVDCIALDLRNNGGGSLPESISLTGLFIDTGPVVQIKDADQRVQQYDDLEPGVAWDGPLVVLVNKFSASASEIVAGAIQDYRRGLVIGDEATHGKGTVQSLLDLGRQLFQRLPNAPSLGAIKITMQQFYRPGGLSTQLEGVKSDVELPSITNHLPVGESDLDNALPFDQVESASFTPTGRVNDAMLSMLRERSAKRVAADEEFQELATDIARYEKRKNEKSISLLKADFTKQWNEGKAAEKEEEEKQEQDAGPRRPVVTRDFYFDEAMSITADYLAALAGAIPGLAQSDPQAAARQSQPVQ